MLQLALRAYGCATARLGVLQFHSDLCMKIFGDRTAFEEVQLLLAALQAEQYLQLSLVYCTISSK